MTLGDIYRQRAATKSDIYQHLEFLHDTVIEVDAKVVVELGVRSGNSTAAFLAAVEKTGGHLWSVDIDVPSWPAQFLQSELVTFIQGNDLAVASDIPAEIDVLFVDTSHYYDHTLAELRLYGPRSTTILLHDTELECPHRAPRDDPPYPVKAAIEAWCAETGLAWSNRPHCYGLGVI